MLGVLWNKVDWPTVSFRRRMLRVANQNLAKHPLLRRFTRRRWLRLLNPAHQRLDKQRLRRLLTLL